MSFQNWLSAIAPPTPQPTTPEAKVLASLHAPQTLGSLSDQTGLDYRELQPLLKRLQREGKVEAEFRAIGSLNCLHYWAKRGAA